MSPRRSSKEVELLPAERDERGVEMDELQRVVALGDDLADLRARLVLLDELGLLDETLTLLGLVVEHLNCAVNLGGRVFVEGA